MNDRKLHEKQKIIFSLGIYLFAFLLNTANVFAENLSPTAAIPLSRPENISPEQARLAKFKRAARKLLLSRLLDKDGKSAKIVILPPMDYTSLQNPNVVTESIARGVRMYDDSLNVQSVDYKMKSLTLEQFRDAVTKLDAELLFVTVMHANNFDMYLYDRRTPYQIYAHSEAVATASQYELNSEIAAYYTKILVRRTLYRFIKSQYYELPRDETPPHLKADIPRFIASDESLDVVNTESTNSFTAQVGLGAAFSSGNGSQLWNSSTIAVQLGYRIVDKTFMKIGVEMSAYNAFMGGVSYLFANKGRLFKTEVGLSIAQTLASKTLDWDRTDSIPNRAFHLVPNASLIVPIMDVNFRLDSQLFIGLNGKSVIFTVIPGLGITF